MSNNTSYLKLGSVIVVSLLLVIGIVSITGVKIPSVPLTALPTDITTEQACVTQGGTWANGVCTVIPQPQVHVPYALSNAYLTIMNALDTDATWGADDATVRVYSLGTFDFTGPYLDSDGNAATSGQIDLDGKRITTGTSYDYLAYQGDGGTNLYALQGVISIPPLTGDKTVWSDATNIYMYKEGAFSESALDSTTAAFDESTDTVTLNKTAETVEGCLTWDFTVGNSVSGSHLKNPVIVFEDSAASPLTDLNDIEEIYLSVKTGSGFSFPSGNLQTEFLGASPIHITTDGSLGSADSGIGTLKVCLPSAEADVGTGSFLMHFDDMGDYRTRDLDNDVRAAAETTTFTINT